MLKPTVLLLFAASIGGLKAQIGGTGAYSILRSPMHARALAWGGYMSSQSTPDPLQATSNPALLRPEHHLNAAFSAGSLLPTIQTANAICAWHTGRNEHVDSIKRNKPVVALTAQFINYGDMLSFDNGGNPLPGISANETNIALMACKPIRQNWYAGAQLGMVYSILGPYVSSGVHVTLATTYVNHDSTITTSLLAKNLGMQVITYRNASRESLGPNLEYSVCFRPKHMPFRFHFTAHNLQRWDLTYNQFKESTGQVDLSGNPVIQEEAGFGEKLARHLAVGIEMAMGKNLSFLFGYSDQRRKEMNNDYYRGPAGFGWGMKFRFLQCDITYSSASYFPGYNSNVFSLILNTHRFVRKPAIKN